MSRKKDPKDSLERIDAFIERQFSTRSDIDIPALIELTIASCQFELEDGHEFIQRDYVTHRVWFFQKRTAWFDSRQLQMFPDLAYLPARIHYRDQNGHSRSIPILDTDEPKWDSFCLDYKRKHQERVNRANARLDRLTSQFKAGWERFGHELTIGPLIERMSEDDSAATN